jgi:hypothetical protein
MTNNLDRLWALEERIAAGSFDPVGLILERPPARNIYEETPLNTLCFARTGGGGVHFSFLIHDDVDPADAPVVLTVPGSENHNIIVGANLLEFLGLGCLDGYFRLEYLSDDNDEVIEHLMRGNRDDMANHERDVLKQVRDEFDLQPWTDVPKRLAELKQQYRALLDFDEGLGLE